MGQLVSYSLGLKILAQVEKCRSHLLFEMTPDIYLFLVTATAISGRGMNYQQIVLTLIVMNADGGSVLNRSDQIVILCLL